MKTVLFLIIGDPFLRSEKAKSLISELEKATGGILTRQTFDLEETPLASILAAARTPQMFSSGQVFRIRCSDPFKGSDAELLAAYLENPEPQSVLIFEADDAKGLSDLQKLAKAKGQLIHLAKDESRSAAAAFIQQKLAQHKKVMSFGAKAKILAMCGETVMFLDSMLERLVQFSGDRREIDEDMVDRFEENWAEMDVFKLTNALVDRDPARVVKIFRELVGFYEADLISLVGILHWQLRQLWQAGMLLASGASERDIGSKLKMSPYRVAALKRFPLERLEKAIEALFQIDRQSKTGQVEGIEAVEAWLLQYAG